MLNDVKGFIKVDLICIFATQLKQYIMPDKNLIKVATELGLIKDGFSQELESEKNSLTFEYTSPDSHGYIEVYRNSGSLSTRQYYYGSQADAETIRNEWPEFFNK